MRRLCLLCLACAYAVPLWAADPVDPPPAISAEWNLRLRHERVDDDAFAPTADAGTARLRAGLRFRAGGWSALLEGEGIANFGDGYNSTANGRTAYPVVADAEDADTNQAWLAWRGARAGATLGRQRLVFDNQRWIGNSGWRQNEQTFDAVALDAKLPVGLTARYAWLDRAHRVNGDEARDPLLRERALDTHLFHLGWQGAVQAASGYVWLHEDRDVPLASTATFGVRSVTNRVKDGRGWGLSLEWARQQPHAANPLDFEHTYFWVEPAWTWNGITWKAGWEHLGGDGRHALQTPLATLHAFNGWADKFNTTPPGGLDDRYLGANGKFGDAKWEWQLAWHDYRADVGGSYGSEWNASLGFPVVHAVKGLVKFADYRADGFARDTRKLWVQLEWAH